MFSRTLRPLRTAAAPRTLSPFRSNVPILARSLVTESAPPVATSQPIAQAQPTSPAQKLPYYVGRNRMNNISVYERRDRGGSLKKTLVKKGEGNLQALKFDIAEALGLTEKDVKVNNTTNHIEIKGHRREDVVQFLRNMGF
ncbi:hypothetical protein TruAng_001243 [Truncatella angustata]|nr:hypothetical protein TruAng_001243 [Truncatella angustata]